MKSKIKKNKNIWHLKQQKENGVNCNTFFRLLTEGKVTLGTAKAKKGEIDWPIAMIQRENMTEHAATI